MPSAENLGEVLRGDRIKNSAYEVAFKVDQACKVLCVKGPLTAEEAEQFSKAVRFFWSLDVSREKRERGRAPAATTEKHAHFFSLFFNSFQKKRTL